VQNFFGNFAGITAPVITESWSIEPEASRLLS